MRQYQDIVLLGTRIALFVFQERRQYAVTWSCGFMDVSDHSIMEKQLWKGPQSTICSSPLNWRRFKYLYSFRTDAEQYAICNSRLIHS